MNLDFSDSEISFRREVQEFLKDHTPSTIKSKIDAHHKLSKDDYMEWHKILYTKGRAAPN